MWISQRLLRKVVLTLIVSTALAGSAAAQDSKTGALAKELAQLLATKQATYAAAKVADEQGRYVAALLIPNVQLLIVSAQFKDTVYMDDRLTRGLSQDVYIDLTSGSAVVAGTRVSLDDLRADGLMPKRDGDSPAGDACEIDGKRVTFDGDWKKQKLTEKDYLDGFARADQQYTKYLTMLIQAMKKPG